MQKKKRGFTLVELLVVIAILAILAAVSVVGYLSFTEKAKQSNDETLLTQLNTILQADEVESKPETYGEVIELMKENGLLIENLTPSSSKNNFIYDLNSNRYNLYNNEQLASLDDAKYWAIAKTEDEYNNYSKLCSVYSVAVLNKTLNLKYGFEDGLNNSYDNITLENATYDSKIVLDLNANNLEVNAPLATVNHYGTCKNVNITKVANNSYHEYGLVEELRITSGHIEFMNNSKVSNIIIEGSDVSLKINDKVQNLEEILIVLNEGVVLPDNAIDKPTSVKPSVKMVLVSSAKEINDEMNKDYFENVDKIKYFKLLNDIVVENTLNTDANSGTLDCTIDLNGFSITNSKKVAGLIALEARNPKVLIKNGTLNNTEGSLFRFGDSNLSLVNITSNTKVLDNETSNKINLYVENCNFSSESWVFTVYKNTVLNINGGTYISNSNPVIVNKGSLTITDGYFENKCLIDSEATIYNGCEPQSVDSTYESDMTVHNGTFVAKDGVSNIMTKARLFIYGGKYTYKDNLVKHIVQGHSFLPEKVNNYWVVE